MGRGIESGLRGMGMAASAGQMFSLRNILPLAGGKVSLAQDLGAANIGHRVRGGRLRSLKNRGRPSIFETLLDSQVPPQEKSGTLPASNVP